eukprot:GHVQ01025029.1.p1 GENE.GHVQ01025029.1~~GHVQ01025029.1.p1  ORF type:complete len:134 (+),score=9.37 GHVQ01025029.1:909-1310(+)
MSPPYSLPGESIVGAETTPEPAECGTVTAQELSCRGRESENALSLLNTQDTVQSSCSQRLDAPLILCGTGSARWTVHRVASVSCHLHTKHLCLLLSLVLSRTCDIKGPYPFRECDVESVVAWQLYDPGPGDKS